MVLDVHSSKDKEGRQVIMWVKHGETNQKWDVQYVDDMPAEEPVKGELNQEFGFYVQRPFHVVSQMPGRRYLDVDGGRNIVIRRESGRILKLGTSTKSQRLSRIRSTMNHSTSKMLENPTTCRSGEPTETGSNNSDSLDRTS